MYQVLNMRDQFYVKVLQSSYCYYSLFLLVRQQAQRWSELHITCK